MALARTVFVLLFAAILCLAVSCSDKDKVNSPNGQVRTTWQKTYGGSEGDAAKAAVEAADGGFVVAGTNSSDGNGSEGWLFKINSSGELVWQEFYGSSADNGFISILLSNDGGYILLGNHYLLKINATHNIVWKTYFDGSAGGRSSSLAATRDGGYAVVGQMRTDNEERPFDVYVAKFASSGSLDWDSTYERGSGIFAEAVAQTADGGFLISGYSAPGESTYVMKLNASGAKMFEKVYGLGISHGISQTSDGGFIIESCGSGNQTRLIRTDDRGQELWNRTFAPDGAFESRTIGTSSDGGYILAGYDYGVDPDNIGLVKTSASGAFLWRKVFGGTGNEAANDVLGCSDGGILIVGSSSSFGGGSGDAYLIKTDKDGNL